VPNPAPARFGGALLDAEGWVTGFCRRGDPRPSYHFMFAQVVAHQVFAGLPDGVPAESVLAVYPALIAEQPRAVRGFVCDAPFVEIGTPADYLIANAAIAAEEGVDPYAPGRRCTIAASAQVTRSILWDDVTVDEGAVVDECILGDGVTVPRDARWSRLAVVRAHGRSPQAPERLDGDLLLSPIS
jgi:mannose-1-phosphate guanylyltransferase